MVSSSSFSLRATSASMTCSSRFWFDYMFHILHRKKGNQIFLNVLVCSGLPHCCWQPESPYPGAWFARQPPEYILCVFVVILNAWFYQSWFTIQARIHFFSKILLPWHSQDRLPPHFDPWEVLWDFCSKCYLPYFHCPGSKYKNYLLLLGSHVIVRPVLCILPLVRSNFDFWFNLRLWLVYTPRESRRQRSRWGWEWTTWWGWSRSPPRRLCWKRSGNSFVKEDGWYDWQDKS